MSHGDHIPIWVRNSATFAFWLPAIIVEPGLVQGFQSEGDANDFWTPRLQQLVECLPYVSEQLAMFAWPSPELVKEQYKLLMATWAQLCQSSWRDEVFSDGCFDWKAFWKLSHVDPRGRPSGADAVFTMFHFFGSLGVSEALAESIGSFLKRYGLGKSSLSTGRVIEKTLLRSAGLQGDGSDDKFIQLVWSEFFGSVQPSAFTFSYKSRTKRMRQRLSR